MYKFFLGEVKWRKYNVSEISKKEKNSRGDGSVRFAKNFDIKL